MRDRLQHALCAIDALERTAKRESPLHRIDPRALLIVTVVFLVTMLSVPLTHLSQLMLYLIFPVVCAASGGLDYLRVFRQSLAVLPFVALIGVFNLFYDRQTAFTIGPVNISVGWVSFLSIVLRGLLSVQALIVLVSVSGYYRLCRSLQRLGVPRLFTTQLLFVYRYLHVLIEEGLSMSRARDARSFGRRSYPLKIWGMLVGQLLIRTFDRAERISRAMLARGFTGRIPSLTTVSRRWNGRDTLYLGVWSATLILMRLYLPAERIGNLFHRF